MSFVDKSSFIRENGVYVSSPQGRSMHPFIRGGVDSVVVRPVTGKIKKYDAVLYERSDGAHVLHRVISVKKDHYVVRGDNCYYKEIVTDRQILGKLEGILRNGKKQVNLQGFYAAAVRVWRWIYPLRRFVHHVAVVFRRIFKKKHEN